MPTARWRHVSSLEEGVEAVAELAGPGVVIKADGLAAGKGVTVADTVEQAWAALEEIFVGSRFASGRRRPQRRGRGAPEGTEISLMALCDGEWARAAGGGARLQAHRRGRRWAEHGRHGLLLARARAGGSGEWDIGALVHQPIVELMRQRGTPFHGILYAGLMLTEDGPRVLEYNVRFGDPETQAVLPRLESDFLDLLLRASRSAGLSAHDIVEEPWLPRWSSRAAVTVVLASAGYPASFSSGDAISGLENVPKGVEVTHAGTAAADEGVVTAGGRVLGVTALGEDFRSARQAAYAATEMITFEGMQVRGDIAAGADTDILWTMAMEVGEDG